MKTDIGGIWSWISRIDSRSLALRLTLLALVLHPVGGESIRLFVFGLALVGLMFPGMLDRPQLWGALTLLTGTRVVLDWPLADNHAYLLAYWCLAIALSCFAKDRVRLITLNARWLIVLVFGFASFWKLILSPDFVDGTFFRVTFLVDPRFEGFTRFIGGLSIEEIEAARAALGRHADSGTLESLAAATPGIGLEWLAFATTAWTLAIEIAVCVTFCWVRGNGPSKFRDGLLIVFCASTYAVATVDGFAWLLIAMGVAQCEEGRPRTRAAYLLTFVLIFFYREVRWLTFLADWMSSS